jgi:predicted DNA-binding transcriptional regulator AlpA
MPERRDVLPTSLPPRGLSREQAAAYVGVSTGTFDALIKEKVMPEPKRLRGRVVWDRQQLDVAFSALPDGRQEGDVWGKVA